MELGIGKHCRPAPRSRGFRFSFAAVVILIFGCSQSHEIDAHQLREHLLQNLGAFADSAAAFVICAADSHQPTDESLAWSGHFIALDEMAETLSSHFKDENLRFAFLMSTFTSAGNSNYKADVHAQTNGCSHAALQRAADFIANARNIQKRYLALPSDALGGHQLTSVSQGNSSKKTVPPRRPGETIEQYLKRTNH